MAVGYEDEVTDKDGSNGAGKGDDVQGGGSDVATLWERELGGNEGDSECAIEKGKTEG